MALYGVRIAKAVSTVTECFVRVSNGVRMHRAFLARNIDLVRVIVTPSTGSVMPASFIITVDSVNPSTWTNFPVDTMVQ